MTAFVRLFRYAFYVLAIAVTLFAGGFLLFTNAIDRDAGTPQAGEGVVALTGGKDRIGQAFKLLATGQAKRLLISGVHPSTKASQLQRLVPRGMEFFPCCVDLGRAALDTRGNAAETRAWVEKHGFSSLIVVTSSYHMPRTLLEFSGAMPDIQLIPHAVVSPRFHVEKWWSPGPTQRLLFYEYLKYLNALTRYARTRLFGPSRSGA
ncbi:MAG: YdcF family protein [Alphaproteobacteria bacterium]